MPTEYDASSKKVKVCRYRGIENPFGHIWQWTDGINVRINPARTACQKSLFALTPQNSMTVTITDIVMLGMKPVPRDMLKKLFLEAAKSFLLS